MPWRSLLTQREKQVAPRGVCSLPDSVLVSRRLGLVGHHLVIGLPSAKPGHAQATNAALITKGSRW